MATQREGAGARLQYTGGFPYDVGGRQRVAYGADGFQPGGVGRKTSDGTGQTRSGYQSLSEGLSGKSLSEGLSGSAGWGLVGGALSESIDQADGYMDRAYRNGATFEQHQFAESRSAFVTQAQAERLRAEEGSRRLRQQHDAEMKIKSIHSRMAELEKQLFTEDETGLSKETARQHEAAESRPVAAERFVSRGQEHLAEEISSRSMVSEGIQRPNVSDSAAVRAAPRDMQPRGGQRLQDGLGEIVEAPNPNGESVGRDLMTVLKEIQRELGASTKAKLTENLQSVTNIMPEVPSRTLVAARRGGVDIDKTLQELRERAKAREELAKKFNARNGPSDADPHGADLTTAKLFQRARQLEEKQKQEEASNRIVSERSQASGEMETRATFEKAAKVAVQRSAAPPPAPTNGGEVGMSHPDRGMRDGRDLVSAPAPDKEEGKSPDAQALSNTRLGVEGKPAEEQTDARPKARGASRTPRDPTPVVSASSFKDYSDGNEPLPPGWELKLDQPTGRKFYVNHELKAISWDRPRASRADSAATSRSLSQSMNGMSSSGDGRARSTNVRSRSGSAAPPLLSRRQADNTSRRRDSSMEPVAPRYIKSDHMGRSMDGSYYQGEEKRRAEMQTPHRSAEGQYGESTSTFPKKWTASNFLDILGGRSHEISQQQGSVPSETRASRASRSQNLLRTSLDSTRLAAMEREIMEDEQQNARSSRPMQTAREKPSPWFGSQAPPDTSTLNLLISAKEKLRNYVFSKVDDDDPLDISPAKGGNQRSDESFYSQWCAERLKDVRSDEEDHEEDVVTEAVGAGGTQLSKGQSGRKDTCWKRASLPEDDKDAQVQAWQV